MIEFSGEEGVEFGCEFCEDSREYKGGVVRGAQKRKNVAVVAKHRLLYMSCQSFPEDQLLMHLVRYMQLSEDVQSRPRLSEYHPIP